ncbi:MAG: hypothetical protein H6631_04400 [Anaerolineaceae bacterium]|nr:hypothetical protein [Anaerolineaceae bacterium]
MGGSNGYKKTRCIQATQFDDLQNRERLVGFLSNTLLNQDHPFNRDSETRDIEPILAQLGQYRVGLIRVPPGCGPSYHSQEFYTAFMPLTGQWRYTWPLGDQTEGKVIVEPADLLFLPTGSGRSFENIGDQEAWLLGIADINLP